MIWLVAFLFVAVQLTIGVVAARTVKSESDFFVAGRRLGFSWVTLSLFATWFGAETCLGSSGAVYQDGLSGARADPLGYGLCLVLLGLLLTRGLHRAGYLTLGDLFQDKFGSSVERLAVVMLIPSGLVWGAAQVRAFGQVLAATTDLPVELSVWWAAGLSIVYTSFGGLLGDVLTDAFQGCLVVLGLIVLTTLVLCDLPSAAELGPSLAAARLSLSAPSESWFATLDRWAVPVLGSLVAQELVARVLAAKSESVARRGSFAAAGLYVLVGCMPVVLGLLGPALVPALDEPEQVLIALSERYLGTLPSLIFSFALLAAILSTIDSILLSTSALVSHNLIGSVFRTRSVRLSEVSKLWAGRATLVLSGLFCLVVALYATGIYDLVEVASALGTAGVLVVTLAALFDPRPNSKAAVLALIVGAAATPIFKKLALDGPYLSSIACATLGYLVVRHLTGLQMSPGDSDGPTS